MVYILRGERGREQVVNQGLLNNYLGRLVKFPEVVIKKSSCNTSEVTAQALTHKHMHASANSQQLLNNFP